MQNKHDNDLLQNDYNKYGDNSFEYEIVEKCPEYMLNYYENKYINFYNSIEKGYNKTLPKLPSVEQKKFSATLRKNGLYMSRVQYNHQQKTFYGHTEEEAIKKVEYWYFAELYLDKNNINILYENEETKIIKRLYEKIDALTNLINLNIKEKNSELNEYITIDELSSLLKISKSSAYDLTSLNDFPKIKIGKSIRIPQIELEKYLKHNLYKTINLK